MKIADCKHLPKKFAKPKHRDGCAENHVCGLGIRVCLTCGYTGCCDSCKGHAREHAENTEHQIMASFPADNESFIWCYEDDDYLDPDEKHNLESNYMFK